MYEFCGTYGSTIVRFRTSTKTAVHCSSHGSCRDQVERGKNDITEAIRGNIGIGLWLESGTNRTRKLKQRATKAENRYL